MPQPTQDFKKLCALYAETDIAYPQLKLVTCAQWALESGWGKSDLAKDHFNYGGLKWRSQMAGFATRIHYQAHDGWDFYCAFSSLQAFISGYWKFLSRSPYNGWEDHVLSAESFIGFIGPIYAPNPTNPDAYAEKVLNLLAPVGELLPDEHVIAAVSHGIDGISASKPPIKKFIQSPNFSSRNGTDIDQIVIHYTTAGTAASSINHFLNPASEVSAHYIVDKNGDIYQMVSDSDKAWHARSANARSIGIEHVARTHEPITPDQERTSIALVKWLMAEYGVTKENILAHMDVVATDCPGWLFGDNTSQAVRQWVDANFG